MILHPSNSVSWGTLVIRVCTGLLLFAFHGWGKLTEAIGNLLMGQEWGFINFVAGLGLPFARFFAVAAALAESVGSVMLMIGLFTRTAAIFILLVMTIAVYYHVSRDMQFEKAALYFVIALGFVLMSPGRHSVDKWLHDRSQNKKSGHVTNQ